MMVTNRCESAPRSSSHADSAIATLQDMIRCSVDNPEIGMVFRRVGHMVSPPEALFAPDILAKVLMYRARRSLGQLLPWQNGAAPAPSYMK